MNTDDLTDVLEDAGLSPYQADAYVAVLELGASPATDIAEASSVPDPRIYDVLRDLETEGYIETYQQGSLHARAHSPSEVLEDLQTRADRFSTAAEEIENRWESPPMEDHRVSIVKRFETVLDRAEELIRDADNQVQLSADPEQYERLAPALAEARDDDVNIKLSLYTHDDEVRADSLPGESALADTCTEARHRTLPSPFIALVDRTWTCFTPHTDSVNEYGILVDDRTHTYVFNWYFKTCLWGVWEPVYSEVRTEPPITYVDIRQCIQEIEPLLEAGETIPVRIEGFETATDERVELTGRIVDTTYSGGSDDGGAEPPLSHLAGRVQLTIDTDQGEYVVGGWGAMLEEIEAVRITLLEPPSDR
ncbi:TrmB family transcriptional regulator [Halostella salina]|uniref:TrmB family transcriptional regulator n=1 Tax=Halostella salina TaxID=1547897 RepID=UPI000EF84C10|nr:TrmB family transcriptional regulator sugar-binding domain-containing protein [Halostella salina]